MSVKRCSRCRETFECCNEKPGCWCESLYLDQPTLERLKTEYDNCLCSNCLKMYATEPSAGKEA